MKFFKTKMMLLAVCSSLMVPSAISAATEDVVDAPTYLYLNGSIHTLIHNLYIQGRYVVDEDTVAVYIPGGIGIIAVDKDTVLPEGSVLLN
ncbi:hypothetical protein D3C85_1297100 [compost metagenome]